jgi:hypothetical protein
MDQDFWTGLITVVLIVLTYRHFKSKKNNQPETKKKGALNAFMEGFNSTSGKKVSKKNEDYEEVDYESNTSKKKGGLASFLAGGIVANKISNPGAPPTITFGDPDVVVMGMKPRGRDWYIKVGRREGGKVKQLGNITVGSTTSSGSSYGGYTVYHSK